MEVEGKLCLHRSKIELRNEKLHSFLMLPFFYRCPFFSSAFFDAEQIQKRIRLRCVLRRSMSKTNAMRQPFAVWCICFVKYLNGGVANSSPDSID